MLHITQKKTQIFLPDEVLVNIFSYLSIVDLLNIGLVCKGWKRFAEDNILFHRLYCIKRRRNYEYDYTTCYKLEYITYEKERNEKPTGLGRCTACGHIFWEYTVKDFLARAPCGHYRSSIAVLQSSELFTTLIEK